MELNEIITIKARKFSIIEKTASEPENKRKPSFWVGLFSILLFVAVFVVGFIAIRALHYPSCITVTIWTFVALVGGYAAYLIVHELLRGLMLLFSRNIGLKDLSFGFRFKSGTAFCISKFPVSVRHLRFVLLVPFFLVSLPLFVYSLVIGDVIFLIAAALSFTVSAADFWYLAKLSGKTKDFFVLEEKPVPGAEEPHGYFVKEIS